MAGAAGVLDQPRDEHLAGINRAGFAPGADAKIDAVFAAMVFPDRLGFIRLFA
ncbi:hypothetical protein D3C87_2011090 [compost metagenome]